MIPPRDWVSPLLALLALAAGTITGLALWYIPQAETGLLTSGTPAQVADKITPAPAPVVGYEAPPFELTDRNGKTVRLQDLRGAPLLINFWATWCDPCREEMPVLESAALEYAGRLTLLGVEAGSQRDAVFAFADALSLRAMILLPDESLSIRDLYRAFALPTSFLVDAGGKIVYRKIGQLDASELRSALLKHGGLQ